MASCQGIFKEGSITITWHLAKEYLRKEELLMLWDNYHFHKWQRSFKLSRKQSCVNSNTDDSQCDNCVNKESNMGVSSEKTDDSGACENSRSRNSSKHNANTGKIQLEMRETLYGVVPYQKSVHQCRGTHLVLVWLHFHNELFEKFDISKSGSLKYLNCIVIINE